MKKKEYESEDSRLPRKFTMADIKVDNKIFRAILIPTYFDFFMTRSNVFSTRCDDLLEGLQEIYDEIFDYVPDWLTFDCPIKFVVCV